MSGALATMPEFEPRLVGRELSHVKPRLRTGDSTDNFRRDLRGPMRAAPIWHLTHEQRSFRLVRPLLVRVRQDEEFFFVENGTLRLVGTGTTPAEALADFCMHFVYFHQYYARTPATSLIGEAKELKRVFATIFVENK